MSRLARLLVPLGLLGGCASVGGIPADRDAAFSYAVERLQAADHARSAAAAWASIQGAGPDDPRHDRALRLLAVDARALGLSHAAALWYLDIAESGRDPTLLPDAVRGLQALVEGGPHDAETLVEGFLATSELAGLPSDLQAFVDYHRGLRDARQRLDAWADARLAGLDPRTPHARRAQWLQAVRQVARRDVAGAQAILEALLASGPLPPDLDADVQRALARLAMEAGDFTAAVGRYDALRRQVPDDPELVLEMAWAWFQAGDTRRTLGLLLALDAPVYQALIAPDRFLLEAMALRRLCQFGPARQAAVRLRARHGAALQALHAGVAPAAAPPVRDAARRRPAVAPLAAFVDVLEREAARVEALPLGDALAGWLRGLYADSLADARRRLEAALAREADAVAGELLGAEEGVDLILHELGVALLRGRLRPDGPPEAAVAEEAGDVRFGFTGEFWTDELDALVVVAEDRCIAP
ncbi:MAG: tetratricopeptide repeat protein [Myxococcales bacterium]|nr:tetratricopeptide repeat protein [Myxococcales bacterium]